MAFRSETIVCGSCISICLSCGCLSMSVDFLGLLCCHLAKELPRLGICSYDVSSDPAHDINSRSIIRLTLVYADDTLVVARRQCRSCSVPLGFSSARVYLDDRMEDLTSTMPTLGPPFSNSATTSAFHPSRDAASDSSPSLGGSTRHIRTVPSRAPVAMR